MTLEEMMEGMNVAVIGVGVGRGMAEALNALSPIEAPEAMRLAALPLAERKKEEERALKKISDQFGIVVIRER
ncbi:hypothetical protein [Sinorhizobium meliloti]|uniref:hypothetical protein n=1 Tax=Rhizobium meliloti TaxID=382 RepID=UPI000FD80E9C|nr:hypothetical protein [Sinorhizobium meliloti]RVL04755.1 hypothetical protein CN152_04310 [Sinorhizobium meliloti]RVN50614.1 hypothetical protein CN113_04775 [Sinorhizobium meliloti]